MTVQPELDLTLPPSRPNPGRVHGKAFRPGPGLAHLLESMLIAAAIAWAVWITHLTLAPEPDRLASVRLSEIVGEFVQAKARSAAPPAQVEAEMRKFMASLDAELQRRSREGQVVLVGEAVLTRNVPDITDQLRRALYAPGARRPGRPTQAEGPALQRYSVAGSPVLDDMGASPAEPQGTPSPETVDAERR